MDYYLDWLVGALALERDGQMHGEARLSPVTLVNKGKL